MIRWVTETLRGRILMGLGILLSGLLVVSLVGVQALSLMGRTDEAIAEFRRIAEQIPLRTEDITAAIPNGAKVEVDPQAHTIAVIDS